VATKLVAFFVTFLINIAIGVVVFFFLLIAMNGYSESDATYGLGSYVALALIVSLLMSAAAAFTTHVLVKREFRPVIAAVISIGMFSVIGAGLKLVCSIIGVAIAEYFRAKY
jgi:hypothetical protein